MNQRWIWDRPGWPEWDHALRDDTVRTLEDIRTRRERLAEESAQAPDLAARAVMGTLLREASSTSEIEDEHISYDDLRDAAAGLEPAEDADPRAAGVVRMLEVCRNAAGLDRRTLLDMHASLLGYLRGSRRRTAPLQIGAYRRTEVYIRSRARGIVYEAPGPDRVERLMANFLGWLDRPLALPANATLEPVRDQSLLAPVKAAIAHIWFERIHPFADGNGRIGRAIAERVLRGAGAGAGYLATVIDVRREQYCEELGKYGESSQGNDISSWVAWFVDACRHGIEWEAARMRFERDRAAFFGGVASGLSVRARRALDEILEDWPGGRFQGGVNDAEWHALLGGEPAPGEGLAALRERGVAAAADDAGRCNALAHFDDVGNRLFEVGVHWIPSSCEQPANERSGQSSSVP